MQDFTFDGTTSGLSNAGPVQQLGSANKPDVQAVQTDFIDNSAFENSGPPTPGTLSSTGMNALYQDSWWYNSPTGTLQGIVDINGDIGTVTTHQASDGSGVYTLGASALSGTNAVGTTGYTFTPAGAAGVGPANATTGQTMTYSGTFGPAGANYLSPSMGGPFTDPSHILGDLLVQNHGTLTVPLAQIVVENVPFVMSAVFMPDQYDNGSGTFLQVGTQVSNIVGGPANVDPGVYLPYVPPTPEPSSFVLATIATLGLTAVACRRRLT